MTASSPTGTLSLDGAVDDILDRLEDRHAAGRAVDDAVMTAACESCPELLDEVRERWAEIRALGGFFESSRNAASPRTASAGGPSVEGQQLSTGSLLRDLRYHQCGGLGEVYEAAEIPLDRTLAVKVLRADKTQPEHREAFEREKEILSLLAHSGIVSLKGAGETADGRPFYTMPFLKTGNLKTKIEECHGRYDAATPETDAAFRECVQHLSAVCKTVAYAHSNGVIHQDLKPANVMLGDYGETLVIDWGSAVQLAKPRRDRRFKIDPALKTIQMKRAVAEESDSASAITPCYASPEQFHPDRPVGPETDIYSLGAILYKLLTDRAPLEDANLHQIPVRACAGDIEPPDTVRRGVPRRLAAICAKAMAVRCADRYRTAMNLAADLDNYLNDAPVSACRDSLATKLTRTVRRNRGLSVAALIALLVGSVALFATAASQSYLRQQAAETARGRLHLAATLAADASGTDLDLRWRMLERSAASTPLREMLTAIAADPENRELWAPVQNWLRFRSDELEEQNIQFQSLFVLAADGTQVARDPFSRSSVGGNYAWRDYFHGGGGRTWLRAHRRPRPIARSFPACTSVVPPPRPVSPSSSRCRSQFSPAMTLEARPSSADWPCRWSSTTWACSTNCKASRWRRCW